MQSSTTRRPGSPTICSTAPMISTSTVKQIGSWLWHGNVVFITLSRTDSRNIFCRVDQDFDQSRVPTLLDKLLPVPKPRPCTPDPLDTTANVKNTVAGVAGGTSSSSSSSSLSLTPSVGVGPDIDPSKTSSLTGGGRNRAVVDSDTDSDRSDTSIESDGDDDEEDSGSTRRKKSKSPARKKRKRSKV